MNTSVSSARYLKCAKAKENEDQLIYSEGIRWDKDLWKGTEGYEFGSFILQVLLIWVIKRVLLLDEAQNREFRGCCGSDLQHVGGPPVTEMACRYWGPGVECVCGRMWVLQPTWCYLPSTSMGAVGWVKVCPGPRGPGWAQPRGWWAQLCREDAQDRDTVVNCQCHCSSGLTLMELHETLHQTPPRYVPRLLLFSIHRPILQ